MEQYLHSRMDKHREGRKYAVWALVFFCILLFNVFERLSFESMKVAAHFTIELTFYAAGVLFIYLLLKKRYELDMYAFLFVGVGGYLATTVVTQLINGNMHHGEGLLYLCLYLAFFCVVALFDWVEDTLVWFAYIANGCLYLFFLDWLILGRPLERFTSYFTNPNISGVFFLCLFVLVLLGFHRAGFVSKLFFSVGLIFGLMMIYAATSRAIYLVLLIMLVSRIVFSISRKWFSRLFYVVMGFNLFFLFFYSYLAHTKIAQSLDAWSMKYLHKSFFSGREDIWTPALEYGKESPLTGYYVDIRPIDYMPNTHYIHSHNQYIQVFLESGLLGFLAFIGLLFVIWRILQRGLHIPAVRVVACFMLGLLFYQSVEISLFFNMKSIGFIQWFILGIGIHLAIQARNDESLGNKQVFSKNRWE